MSIWFMFDNHSFFKLDGKPVDEAMDDLEQCVDSEGGYGFIGCKGEHGNETLAIRPGKPWRLDARRILSQ